MATRAVQKGADVLFFTQAKLLANQYAARAANAYEKRIQTLARVPLLFIDDFGLKALKSPKDEDLHGLVDKRYEQNATIIASNLDFTMWGDAFPNKLLAAATLDRLRHNPYRLILEGESYRKLRPKSKHQKLQNWTRFQKRLIISLSESKKKRFQVAPLGRK